MGSSERIRKGNKPKDLSEFTALLSLTLMLL